MIYIMSQIICHFSGAHDLLEYFTANYVLGPLVNDGEEGVNLRIVRRVPIFPPNTWNVNEATLNNEPRTNNVSESFNNR